MISFSIFYSLFPGKVRFSFIVIIQYKVTQQSTVVASSHTTHTENVPTDIPSIHLLPVSAYSTQGHGHSLTYRLSGVDLT